MNTTRQPPSASHAQLVLRLEGEAENALRAAYHGSGLRDRGVSYEAAMRDAKFAIPLRRTAEAVLRAKTGN